MTRVGIVGASHWHTPRHIEAFTGAGATIVAVQDDDANVGRAWGDRLSAAVEPTLESFAARRDLDLVIAMPRHNVVRPTLETLIDAGIPFVVEKPAGADASALDGLAERARLKGLFTSVAYINRYGTIWDRVADLPAPTSARFRIVNGTPARYVDDGVGWVVDPEQGGGPLRNIGSHTVEAFASIAVGDIEVVGAAMRSDLFDTDVDDHVIALLRDEAGTLGTIEAGYTHPERDGTDQEWTIAGPGYRITETDAELTVITSTGSVTEPTASVARRYDIFAVDTLRRFADGRRPLTDLDDAQRVLELIDRVYDHAAQPAFPAAQPTARH